jgi:hypothetical protein
MADEFTAGAGYERTIFSCPNCNETIDSNCETCRYCGVRIDKEEARKGVLLLAKINQACSEASTIRSTSFALIVFFLLSFAPFFGMVGSVGFFGLLFGIPIWTAIWWYKYGRISTKEEDFKQAKRRVQASGAAVLFSLIVYVLLRVLLFHFLLSRR